TALTSYHWEWAHDNQECWISMNGRMSASETAGRNSERRTTVNGLPMMDNEEMELEDSVARVRERIAAACRRAGRRPESIRLVAVSKTVAPALIRRAYDVGLRDFGESRVQEAVNKRAALSDLAAVWHLIGHLQTNKAKSARELFHWVHSVDSVR